MNMIEKIATAMREAVVLPGTEQEQFRAYARIALETLKEPTEEMLAISPNYPYMSNYVWSNMIEVALKG